MRNNTSKDRDPKRKTVIITAAAAAAGLPEVVFVFVFVFVLHVGTNDCRAAGELLKTLDVEPAALHAIARGADGGMRDAESTLDQLISFCGEIVSTL